MFALQPFFERIPASEWIRVKANLRPKCHEMRVGGFHIDYEEMEYDIVTNLSCPKCESYVEVYHKIEK